MGTRSCLQDHSLGRESLSGTGRECDGLGWRYLAANINMIAFAIERECLSLDSGY